MGGNEERKKKKSEVGRGKSTSIIGQAAVQVNVEVLARGLPSTSASRGDPKFRIFTGDPQI